MMTRGKLGWVMVVALAAGVWGAGVTEAQIARRGRPLYGSLNLQAGFMPDPQLLRGNMGGSVDASRMNASCRGTVNPQPSHVIVSRTGFRNLRLVVNGQGDSTLMVILPNGAVLCDDDSGGGRNPLIETSSPAGAIQVWVGVWSSSAQGEPYTLGVTERANITSSNLTAPAPHRPQAVSGITPNARPSSGMVHLRPGFMPDPHVVAGRAGGPVSASNVDARCRGYVSAQPNHVIMTQAGFRNLRVVVNGGRLDTTLMVMTANGQVFCNDDGGGNAGTNPVVQLSTTPGPIRIWVGTYGANQSGQYRIGFTELSHIGPSSLPAPGYAVPPRPTPRPQVPTPPVALVQMQVNIPVTLLGPGLAPGTVALWQPRRGNPTQITLRGRALMAGNVTLATLPASMQTPVVTVMQRRNGTMIVRAEQAPMRRRGRGESLVLRVRWRRGEPTVADRWSGRFGQRGPRWAR